VLPATENERLNQYMCASINTHITLSSYST
jgi:hypothetical protein